MLKKQFRGLSEKDVSHLFSGPHKTMGNSYFRVNWQDSDKNFPQFVVVTPRKIVKSAVERNRLRRQIYELIRLGFLHWTGGIRVAILIKNASLELPRRQFRDEFVQLMHKAHLFS